MNTPQGQPAGADGVSGADPVVSLETRIGALLHDGPPAKARAPKQQQAPVMEPEGEPTAPEGEVSETGESQESAPDTFEVEYEGEKFVLPKKLEKAVMQERDYTQKSMAVAEKERRMELLQEQAKIANFRQAFEAEVAPDLQQLNAYDAVLKQPVDWSSMTTDEAFRKKLQLDQWKDERAALAQSLNVKHQQWGEKTRKALEELNSKSDEVVSKRVPNWNAETWKTIREHAKADGYTDTELGEIRDPRHKLTLWKAKQFDELKAKATKTVVDAKGVKTTSSNPMPQHVKEKLAFRKQIAGTAPNSFERKQAIESRVAGMFEKR
jgi:hypothetical protein